jgi:hypothetical protein
MNSMPSRKKIEPLTSAAPADLSDLRAREAATKGHYDALATEISKHERRLNEPLADDTRETRKQIRIKLFDLQDDLAIAKREYESAASARGAAEAEAIAAADRKRRLELEARRDEADRAPHCVLR